MRWRWTIPQRRPARERRALGSRLEHEAGRTSVPQRATELWALARRGERPASGSSSRAADYDPIAMASTAAGEPELPHDASGPPRRRRWARRWAPMPPPRGPAGPGGNTLEARAKKVSPTLAHVGAGRLGTAISSRVPKWFERDVMPRLTGTARLFRYADDAVMVFANERDARRVLDVLAKRCAKYGLTLHPEKTRLVEFRRPNLCSPPNGGAHRSGPGTFDLLGFTHFWGRSRAGKWVVKRKTMRARFARAVERVTVWCRKHLHDPIREQWRALTRKLNGHYAYYGITFNYGALARFKHVITLGWWRALQRRSQRGMSWKRMEALLRTYSLPPPRIVRRLALPAANP